MEKSLKSLRKLCLGISWGLCCNGDLIIFHLVGPIKYSPHKMGRSFCWVSDTILSVVPKVGNTEAQIPYKSGIVGIFCALWLLPVCQCTDCHGTDFVYHRCTTSFWVMMSEGMSMQPQCNSINFNRSGWKIIAVSRSREDTEWVSYGEIRIMAPSMLLIFELYVPILDKQVKKVLQKYIPQLAWSRRHGERWSPGQQYNSPTALSVWQPHCLAWPVILTVLDIKTSVVVYSECHVYAGNGPLHCLNSSKHLWTFSVGVQSYGLGFLILLWREADCKEKSFCESKTETHTLTVFKDHVQVLGVSRGEWSYSRHSVQALIKFSIPLHSLRNMS